MQTKRKAEWTNLPITTNESKAVCFGQWLVLDYRYMQYKSFVLFLRAYFKI